jgi:hypothetical protein
LNRLSVPPIDFATIPDGNRLHRPVAHCPFRGQGLLGTRNGYVRFTEGLAAADTVVRPGSRLRLVPLPHLVALKLYAGGMKSRADIVELLVRNPNADTTAIRELCLHWQLGGLDQLIEEARSGPAS